MQHCTGAEHLADSAMRPHQASQSFEGVDKILTLYIVGMRLFERLDFYLLLTVSERVKQINLKCLNLFTLKPNT